MNTVLRILLCPDIFAQWNKRIYANLPVPKRQ